MTAERVNLSANWARFFHTLPRSAAGWMSRAAEISGTFLTWLRPH